MIATSATSQNWKKKKEEKLFRRCNIWVHTSTQDYIFVNEWPSSQMGINVSNSIHLFKFDNTNFEIWPLYCTYDLASMFFLSIILWCGQSSDHLEKNQIKFGQIIDMKVLLENIILYSWLHGTYHTNLVIWKKFTKNLMNLLQFFPWETLCIGWNHVFHVEIWQKFTSEKVTDLLGLYSPPCPWSCAYG
jgi:hypothetical protein